MKIFPAMLLFLALFPLSISVVDAHQTDQSMMITEVRPQTGEVELLFSISAEDLAHNFGLVSHGQFPSPAILGENRARFQSYLDHHIMVRTPEEECQALETDFVAYPGQDGRLHYHLLFQCPLGASAIVLGNQVMFSSHGGYRHQGRIQVGEEISMTVYDANYPTYTVNIDPALWPVRADSPGATNAGATNDGESPEDQERPGRTRVFFALLAIGLVVSTLLWLRSQR